MKRAKRFIYDPHKFYDVDNGVLYETSIYTNEADYEEAAEITPFYDIPAEYLEKAISKLTVGGLRAMWIGKHYLWAIKLNATDYMFFRIDKVL